MTAADAAIYWDASAAISTLIADSHSSQAADQLAVSRAHVLSTLAYTEVLAVLGRLRREHTITDGQAATASATLQRGPWHRLSVVPTWATTHRLAQRWPLRGADLWHLATADTLRRDFSAIRMLTFDRRLREAAKGEGLL